jgi:hypothetical protein
VIPGASGDGGGAQVVWVHVLSSKIAIINDFKPDDTDKSELDDADNSELDDADKSERDDADNEVASAFEVGFRFETITPTIDQVRVSLAFDRCEIGVSSA